LAAIGGDEVATVRSKHCARHNTCKLFYCTARIISHAQTISSLQHS
jgi:hypothetical protein